MQGVLVGRYRLFNLVAILLTALVSWQASPASGAPQQPDAFQPLLGWWVGQGRLGFKSGKTENVRCRATYRRTETGDGIRQALRCASASGAIEVKSTVLRQGDELSGTWSETKYNFAGEVSGKIIPRGFRVVVSGAGVKANMTVAVRKKRHIVEIQFVDSALIGLTMIFARS
ncbi:MAG: hypothetical protein AAGB04_13505 [Pseudomonadota bacterium]